MKTYEFIALLKNEHLWIWKGCCILFERANTLDFYFNIYSLILQTEHERRRGYRKRLIHNHQIISIVKKNDSKADWEESNIDWVIKTMETQLFIV